MNMINITAIFTQHLPWLVTILFMAIAILFLVKQQVDRRREIRDQRKDLDHLHLNNRVLTERITNHEANLERERLETGLQMEDVTKEKNDLRKAYDDSQRENGQLLAQLSSAEAKLLQIDILTGERKTLREEFDSLQKQKNDLETGFAAMQTQMEEERKSSSEKIDLLEKAEQRLAKEFENLANRIFEEKHQKFSEVSKTNIETILNPMRQQLTDFHKKVDHVYDTENKDRASLLTEIKLLKGLNERISAEALNLTRALKGDSKLRGNWGEMQLARLLEESGLVKGREYDIQVNLKDEEGKRFQPDVVVHLPETKDVVIDSKVSLVAYEQVHSAETEEERQKHVKTHISSIRTHIHGLSAKNYDELIGVNSLDLVIMFMPIEPALLLAFEEEPNLYNEAFSKGILLVSPSTLMATLQIIQNIWRYEHQNQNAIQIATEAGKLHDQFVLFINALEMVGNQIRKAGESYETAHKRLTSGRGNLVLRTHNLQVLGAKAKKCIEPALLKVAATDNEELQTILLNEEQITEEIIE
jgi:DNA recombination protein RmuC